jgi:hypothetical protein
MLNSRRTQAGLGGFRAQIDAEHQHPAVERGLGVTQHGEVHEVGLGLLLEPLAVGPLDGRQATVPDGLGTRSEPCQHFLGIELLGHVVDRSGALTRTVAGPPALHL